MCERIKRECYQNEPPVTSHTPRATPTDSHTPRATPF